MRLVPHRPFGRDWTQQPVLLPPLCSNGDLHLDTGLDVDDDLLDHLGRRIQIDEALVDSHLEHVPCLTTLTARGLSGGDLESLGGQTDGALDAEVLGLCALEEFGADLLEGLDFARGQGDADLVDFLFSHVYISTETSLHMVLFQSYRALAEILLGLLERHGCGLVFEEVLRFSSSRESVGANHDLNYGGSVK